LTNKQPQKENLETCLQFIVDIFKELVDDYADVWVSVEKPPTQDHQISDFVYFCITRSCKSLIGLQALIKAGCPEDAITLVRSIYESYLKIVYVAHHPNEINQFVTLPIGISMKYYPFAKTKKNKPDLRNVVDPRTGSNLPVPMSIEKLALASPYPEDKELHNCLYKFLSEHAHPHMMASGDYRSPPKERQYTYKNRDNSSKALFFAIYVSARMLEHFPYKSELELELGGRLGQAVCIAKSTISSYIAAMDSNGNV
jgi:hypothetical protein